MPVLFWGLAVAGSRMLYFFLKKQEIADTYGYFANAMIQMKKNDMAFHSGLAGVYTENLSVLLRFTGNRIEAAGVYQMVLQILWIFLLFTGISLMFGRLAGIISASVLAALPVVLKSILIVWPGNFYMLNFSQSPFRTIKYSLKFCRYPHIQSIFAKDCLLCLANIVPLRSAYHNKYLV